MDVFLQQCVNAISLGGIYALLALGLAVVFSIVRLINFAHGEVMTIAGYAIWLALLSSVPVAAAILLGIIVAMLASVAMERIAFRAMRGASVTSLLITSFAVSEIVKVLFQNGISARPVPIVLPAWMSGSLNFGFLTISVMSVISIIVVAVSLVALGLEIVDQLCQIFDRINIMVRWRRNQTNTRHRETQLGDIFGNFVSR